MMAAQKKPPFAAIKVNDLLEPIVLDAASYKNLHFLQHVGIGSSMLPTLLPGDKLELSKVDERVLLGEIVTFRLDGQLVTHRVIRTEGARFWARGDNSDAVQGPVGPEDVVGRVVAVVREGRRIELGGSRERLLGLARNYGLAAARAISLRYPRLRRLVEIDLLSSPPVRAAQRLLVGALLGNATVTELPDRPTLLASVISPAWPGNEKDLRWLERKINAGQVQAFRAGFPGRRLFVGSVVLIEDSFKSTGKLGYVGWLLVQLGFRGAGIGRALLETLENSARKRGIELLWAEVMPDNVRSLGLFQALGYRRLSSSEMARWPKTLQKRLLPGRVVLGKRLATG